MTIITQRRGALEREGRRRMRGRCAAGTSVRLGEARIRKPFGTARTGHTDTVISVAFSPDNGQPGPHDHTIKTMTAPLAMRGKRRVLRLTVACFGTMLAALAIATTASAHDTGKDRLVFCDNWSQCGYGQVTNNHRTVTAVDTWCNYSGDRTIFVEFKTAFGGFGRVWDPDGCDWDFGRWTVPSPSLDSVTSFRTCQGVVGTTFCTRWGAP
jgi:hypothetical protein